MADGIEDGLGLTQATFLVLPGPSRPSPVGGGGWSNLVDESSLNRNWWKKVFIGLCLML